MATENAIRDQNHVPTALAVLNTDTVQGTNLVRIKIKEDDQAMLVDSVAGISFTMVPIDPRDKNYVNCMTFEGSNGLVYPWVATSAGAVLVDIT